MLVRKRSTRSARPSSERLLLTVLFTDLVASTEHAHELGDARWGELLAQHNTVVRKQIELFKGREVKTIGDGFLVTFDAPTRAVRCALAIRTAVAGLGLEIRCGVHTGECDLVGGDIAGLTVNLASRVQSVAQRGEVLLTRTTRDLVVEAVPYIVDRGEFTLKGVPGTWQLFAVEPGH